MLDKRPSYLRFFIRYLVLEEIILISSSLIYRNHPHKFKKRGIGIREYFGYNIFWYNNFYLIPIMKKNYDNYNSFFIEHNILYSQMWIKIKKLFIQMNVSRNKNNLTSITKRNTLSNKSTSANLCFIVSSINRRCNYWNNSINIRELIK